MSFVKSAPAAPSFRLDRQRLELRFRLVRLAARQWLTPGYVRIRVEGSDLRASGATGGADSLPAFDSLGADDHLRIFFPDEPPSSLDAAATEALRAAPSREYTPLAWNADDGWLDLEFALHGSDGSSGGIAANWAATAEIGSMVGIGGPRGSMIISGRPDAWFLAGDETAVPAMRRFAHQMDTAAVGTILVEVADAAHELPIDAPPGVNVEQVHRDGAAAGTALAARLAALTADDRPAGDVFAFVAAEQGIVRAGRDLLLERWGLDGDRIVVKGYWKRGEAEYHAPH
ncbi:MAG: siderophore-interacting protein [Microbacterium sp.]|nr:MAG: siderophore-interacting protein [Microbacterium sp.]